MNRLYLLTKLGAVLERLGRGVREPLFVIGTGRCGSSLLARILSSHKQLVGYPGEANELWHPNSFPYSKRTIRTPTIIEDAKRFSEASVSSWPANHKKTIRSVFLAYHFVRGSHQKFFVKSAMISFLIPSIRSAFPDAKFIHIFRSGPSVVASLAEKEWHKHANRFESALEFRKQCARYWSACILEIERRNLELSLVRQKKLLEISYEGLCEHPRLALDEIAQYLEISTNGFGFDISKISSRNDKVGDCMNDDAWTESLQIMSTGMQLKGYSVAQ